MCSDWKEELLDFYLLINKAEVMLEGLLRILGINIYRI